MPKKKIKMSQFVDETGKVVADDAQEADVVGEVSTLYYYKLRTSPKYRIALLKGLVRARAAANERLYEEYYAAGGGAGPWGCERAPVMDNTRWHRALEILSAEIVHVTEWIYREPPRVEMPDVVIVPVDRVTYHDA